MKSRFTKVSMSTFLAASMIVATTPAFATDTNYGDCKVTGTFGQYKLTPAAGDTFAILATLPAPGDYNGDTAETIRSGYSYCLAAEIAHRGGLPSVSVRNVSFDALVSGRSKDFDAAILQLFKNPEREKVVDFSVPYLRVNTGIMVRKNSDITAQTIKDTKIGVLIGSVNETFVKEQLRPSRPLAQFQSISDMVTALMARQIDVVLLDTTLTMIFATQTGKFKVIGQYEAGGDAGVLLPKGSANTPTVNKIIEDLRAEGRLDSLLQEQLAPFMGGNPKDLPIWKVQ
jgi:polar amino acid transport system substrate-binding protein